MKRGLQFAGLVVTVLLVCSRPAEANIWDVLEALSGPGPFHSEGNISVSGLCVHTGRRLGIAAKTASNTDLEPATPCFFLDIRRFASDTDDRFFAVDAQTYEFGTTFQLRRPFGIGAAMGWIHFNSHGVSTNRVTLTPIRLVIRPLFFVNRWRDDTTRKWPGFLQYYVRQTVIAGRLTGKDFGVSDAVFSEKNKYDIVTSAGFIIDIGELIGR